MLREATWLACAAKSCCHANVVPTGRDVWRIARALDAPPWSFLLYFEAREACDDGFALDASDRRYRLVLRKQEGVEAKPPPCVYLTATRHGEHRCGLGELRPAVCRSFPAELVGGVLCMTNDHGCTCRTWTMVDTDVSEARAAVLRRDAERAEYAGVVARWNARVALLPPGAELDFFAYCDYLIDAYDEIGAEPATA